MAAYSQLNNYISNHYEGMSPEQLIFELYKGALSRLKLTRQGIQENDVRKRGENLSKAIAIISELNASVDPKMNDESTRFLRGLYTAILTELPKVSLNNDLVTLDRAQAYISELKNIWERDVMANKNSARPEPARQSVKKPAAAPVSAFNGYNNSKMTFHAISV